MWGSALLEPGGACVLCLCMLTCVKLSRPDTCLRGGVQRGKARWDMAWLLQ